MRRTALFAMLVLAAAALSVAPVAAVTNGQPDGNRHPYVGVAIQELPNGGFSACSGSALDAHTFLTAAHCFDPSREVLVSYQPGPKFDLAKDFTPGTFHPHPDWCAGCAPGLPNRDTHDVAVIVLDEGVDPGRFATLPSAGLVDTLPMRTKVEIVGYGVHGLLRGGGRPQQLLVPERRFALSELITSEQSWSDEFIKLTANPADGKGSQCAGDSGGPDLLGGTDIILAVNSYSTSTNCTGVSYANRVDTADILTFIGSF
jgi:hypothetical protein